MVVADYHRTGRCLVSQTVKMTFGLRRLVEVSVPGVAAAVDVVAGEVMSSTSVLEGVVVVAQGQRESVGICPWRFWVLYTAAVMEGPHWSVMDKMVTKWRLTDFDLMLDKKH